MANQFDEWLSPAEVLMQLENPSWEDRNSQLVAIAGLMIPEMGEDISRYFVVSSRSSNSR
ncbi:MAG: hypothetical protein AAGJ08_03525 [Cyanobacteria bacterium P01_H01_bin.35]